MFAYCKSLETIDMLNWDLSNANNLYGIERLFKKKENTVFYVVVEYSLSWNIRKYSTTMFRNILTFLISVFHVVLDWPKSKTM